MQQRTLVLTSVQQQTHTCFQVELLHRVHAAEGPQADATLKARSLLQCCITHTLRQTSQHCYIPLDRRRQTSQPSYATHLWTDKDRHHSYSTHFEEEEAALLYASVRWISTVSSGTARSSTIWRSLESEHRHETAACSVSIVSRCVVESLYYIDGCCGPSIQQWRVCSSSSLGCSCVNISARSLFAFETFCTSYLRCIRNAINIS